MSVCEREHVINIGSLKYSEELSVVENASRWAVVTSLCGFVHRGDLCPLVKHMSHPGTCLLLNCFGLPRLLWELRSSSQCLWATGMWTNVVLYTHQTIIQSFFLQSPTSLQLIHFLLDWMFYCFVCTCMCGGLLECDNSYYCPLGLINTPWF